MERQFFIGIIPAVNTEEMVGNLVKRYTGMIHGYEKSAIFVQRKLFYQMTGFVTAADRFWG